MKVNITVLLILLILSSCGNFIAMNNSNPSKKSFKYYNPNFKLDSLSNLRVNQKYVMHGSTTVNILLFFSDGFLNNPSTLTVDGVSSAREESGVTMGYYKLVGDSIFFTTASFYRHRQTHYQGRINGDTLELTAKHSKYKDSVFKYTLYHYCPTKI